MRTATGKQDRNSQARPFLIPPGNQQRHPKWPTHDTLLTLGTLAKPQGKITDTLRAALDSQRLAMVERVALSLYASVLDERPCVGLESGHGASDVAVDFDDLLDR